MTVTDMELRLDFLKGELKRELSLLESQTSPEAMTTPSAKRERKASVGRIMLELGSLQMRLREPNRRA